MEICDGWEGLELIPPSSSTCLRFCVTINPTLDLQHRVRAAPLMPSRHPRAAAFIAAGLYRNLSSFRELEARIAALPEEIVRGDAFEIFVEGDLRTMPVFQCADLWPVGQVPLDIRRALNLPADASDDP